jgi:Tfp pilus assembly protein PilN
VSAAAASPASAVKPRASRRGADRPATPVNLARRPFANTRHLRRLGIALWVLAAGLLALDGVLYWRSLFGIESKKEERAAVDAKIAQERERLATAEERLAAIDLTTQNVEATFLNARIAERTFPWSALFDELAAVLPRQVRLMSLAPVRESQLRRTGSARQRDRTTSQATTPAAQDYAAQRVYLEMTGIAESDEALLELIDNLFESPAFDAPTLPNERRVGNSLEFSISVFYLPGSRSSEAAGAAPPEVVEEGAASPSPDAAPSPAEAGP